MWLRRIKQLIWMWILSGVFLLFALFAVFFLIAQGYTHIALWCAVLTLAVEAVLLYFLLYLQDLEIREAKKWREQAPDFCRDGPVGIID